MPTAVTVLIVLTVPAVTLGSLPWLAKRARRRGVGSILAPFEEIWHPAAHQARIRIEVQDERVAPVPSPGDPPTAPGP